ncbi:hypothetical protein [Brevibacillus brevis]|uniref:hypothetical protein n=1 Tax=Brevibacillus brevis TaxID=1393 RepID=UPI001EDBED7E|nr:hypothetical protein [Brevibacillus brevis]UKK99886.1 hypothetical protein FO446_21775 [Brevibacillus brevis]
MDFIQVITNFQRNFIRDGMDSNEVKGAFREANLADLNYLMDLYGTYSESSMFYEQDALEELKNYTVNNTVIEFYRKYEPHNLPTLSGGIRLLALESLKVENASASPSMYLIKFGLLTIATTIGGHAICLDLNTENNNEPRVVIADQAFCSYNEDLDLVECVIVPDGVAENYADDEPIILSYSLIEQCLPEIAVSFSEFLVNLSLEKYENVEEDFLII